MIPDVYFVGPRKCATTWLYDFYKKSSDVALCRAAKEIFYFDRFYHKGTDWYESYYDFSTSNPILEFSPSYFGKSDVPGRIKELAPNAKVVITLRDPVNRLVSDYQHHKKHGHVGSGIVSAIEDSESLKEQLDYGSHIKRWKKVFGESNVLILYHEDMKEKPIEYVNKINGFIGVSGASQVQIDSVARSNEAGSPRNRLLSKVVTRVSFYMRSIGAVRLIAFFKKIGIKRIVFKEGVEGGVISDQDLAQVKSFLSRETERYENREY